MTELESIVARLLRDISLTSEERSRLRFAILAATRQTNPLPNAAVKYTNGWWQNFTPLFARAAFVAVIIVFISGGTVALAERTLPGDALYLVKITLNERLRDVFAQPVQSDLAKETARTQRRLLEAEQLAVTGRLTSDRQKVAEDAIATQLAMLDEQVREQLRHSNLPDAAAATSIIEAKLYAHEAALNEIERSSSAPPDPIRTITERVAIAADETARVRINLEQQLRGTVNTNPTIQQAAEKLLAEAERLTPEVPPALTAPQQKPTTTVGERLTPESSYTDVKSFPETATSLPPSDLSSLALPSPAAPALPVPVRMPRIAVEESRANLSAGQYGEAIVNANEALRDITERTTVAELNTALGLPIAQQPFPGDFAACRAAGYKIVNSLPRTCTTPDGKIFTEKETPAPTKDSGANAEPRTTGLTPAAPATLSPSPQ